MKFHPGGARCERFFRYLDGVNRLYEKAEIRRRLRTDPAWSAYALGDLDDCRFHHSEWFGFPDDSSIALWYREFPNPVFFYSGTDESLERLLPSIPFVSGTHLQIRPAALPLLAARTPIAWSKSMIRMRLQSPAAGCSNAVPLGIADADALTALYADGAAAGESPDFFFPSMLDGGFFFGIWRNRQLVAAAGTHIVSRGEGAAAIGNVYTHREYRGQGLAQSVTSAVTAALLAAGIQTVILNVAAHNAAAIHVYEKLGFVRHCEFFEALTA